MRGFSGSDPETPGIAGHGASQRVHQGGTGCAQPVHRLRTVPLHRGQRGAAKRIPRSPAVDACRERKATLTSMRCALGCSDGVWDGDLGGIFPVGRDAADSVAASFIFFRGRLYSDRLNETAFQRRPVALPRRGASEPDLRSSICRQGDNRHD